MGLMPGCRKPDWKCRAGDSCNYCQRELNKIAQEAENPRPRRNKGGIHVGRPHTSKNDERVHVTSTHRNDRGKKVREDDHHTSLGSIAHGAANWDTSRDRRR